MFEIDREETVSKAVSQFDMETTQKNPRGKLIDTLSILKVDSTLKFPR